MKTMREIRDMLEDELFNAADHGSLSLDKLKVIDLITHSIKSIDTITAMSESGYSGTYDVRGYRHPYSGGYDRRYSRDGKDTMTRLNDMLREASTDRERDAIRACIDMMK